MSRSGTVASLRFAILVAVVAFHGQVRAQAGDLSVTKTLRTVSDPISNVNPRNIPGAVVDYSITVRNQANTRLDGGAMLIDTIPPRTELRVADLPLLSASDLVTLTAGPIDFQTGLLSGVSYTFGGFGNTTDSLEFSSNNRASWTYTPVPNGDGYDPAVTDIRIRFPTGLRSDASYSVRFRVRVR